MLLQQEETKGKEAPGEKKYGRKEDFSLDSQKRLSLR